MTEKYNTELKLQIPLNKIPTNHVEQHNGKKKHRDKSDLGDNFVAPEGGWGWLITIAAGLDILVAFGPAQNFGILFRTRLYDLGISSSQLTTITNVQLAISSITGLLNGPMFRKYTFRQVGVFGAVFMLAGLLLAVFADSFILYLLSFSCLYGIGRGLILSATSMVINTYFNKKRRTAVSYQLGVAGVGPIVLPFLTTYLLDIYGVQGTVLLIAAFSLHTIPCALLFQPVQWHLKKTDAKIEEEEVDEINIVTATETPIIAHSNDGWYGSRTSLRGIGMRRNNSSDDNLPMRDAKYVRRNSKLTAFSVSYSIKEDVPKSASHFIKKEPVILEHEIDDNEDEEARSKLPFYKKVIIFFDLDLLKDVTYMNLAVGITLINFVDLNFNILTPFVLADFGYTDNEIATVMSLLGVCDLFIRFGIPTITSRLPFNNQTFFCIGVTGLCLGRIALGFTNSFTLVLIAFLWMGFSKALRIVFFPLLIPSYVSLKRLPAANGLQLLMSGIFFLILGPFVGLVRDRYNYVVTLNILNIFSYFAILMWILEALWQKRKNRKIREAS